jgi:hypothetical protein
MIAARGLPLGLILLGLASALVAALVAALSAISAQKGLWRLASSLLVGAAFTVGSIAQMLKEKPVMARSFRAGIRSFFDVDRL